MKSRSRFYEGARTWLVGILASCIAAILMLVSGRALAADLLFAPQMEFAVDRNATDVQLRDLNGDGNLDAISANYFGSTVSVLLGNGDGTFEPRADFGTAISPFKIRFGDLNSDGHLDLVVGCISATLSVLLGNPNGTFGPATNYDFGGSEAIGGLDLGDLNGDGFLDVVASGGAPPHVEVRLGHGDGTFSDSTRVVAAGPYGLALADLNGDHKLDLISADYWATYFPPHDPPTVSVSLGNGNGTFQSTVRYPSALRAFQVYPADLDGDGDVDIVTADAETFSVSVLLNLGNGTFGPHTDYSASGRVYGATVADLNGDGIRDIVAAVSRSAEGASYFLGRGDGTFNPEIHHPTDLGPYALAAGDLTGDGRPELVVANYEASLLSVLVNLGCDPLNGISAIVPNRGGQGQMTMTIFGCGFDSTSTVSLSRGATQDIIPAEGVQVALDGRSLQASFDLTSQPLGAWDVVVTRPGAPAASRPGGFEIQPLKPAELWMTIVGPARARVGAPRRWTVVTGNAGNEDFKGGPTITSRRLAFIRIRVRQIDVTTIVVRYDGLVVGTYNLPAGGSEIVSDCLLLPWVSAGSPSPHHYTVEFSSVDQGSLGEVEAELFQITGPLGANDTPGSMIVGHACGNPPLEGLIWKYAQSLGLWPPNCTPFPPTFLGVLGNGIDARLRQSVDAFSQYGMPPQAILAEVIRGAIDNALVALDYPGGFPTAVAAYRPVWTTIKNNHWSDFRNKMRDLCAQMNAPPAPPDRKCFPCTGRVARLIKVAPTDPNDKYGPTGVGDSRFIPSGIPLTYAVHFENIPTASAPAQQVVVEDQLDSTKVDLATLSLGDIEFGARRVTVVPGQAELRADVDLRPDKNLILRIVEQLDRSTGLLTCRFSSLDPATGLQPEDPLEGFLPPNVAPPEGEGGINFTVMPKSALPNGTYITNIASIVFDENAPITTPEWLNTIDTSKPSSQVTSLETILQSTSFVVHWAGTDDGSGIESFDVLVSQNGGPYSIWRHTAATSDTFPGEDGNTYAFYSVALDLAGNEEEPPASPDASIGVFLAVEPGAPRFDLQQIVPNPSWGHDLVVTFSVPVAAPVRLDLIDIAGRRVASRSFDRPGPGFRRVRLASEGEVPPGVYLVRLTQSGQSLTRRVTMMR